MGVQVRITVYAPDQETAARACAAAFGRFAVLEDVMSDYRPTSELMRLCAKAGGRPVPVSRDLFVILERALAVSAQSRGAFDVTVGPFVALWRRARKTGQLPSATELATARTRVGWQKVRLDKAKQTVRLLVPHMRLDLGGIAKGYAADGAQAVLQGYGVACALVEAGGDLVASGPPPGRAGWRVALANAGTVVYRPVATLANEAVSSSGDAEQFVDIGGRRYSHVVDPRTGLGLTRRIGVTVVAPDGITSDSLSTAVGVLGPEAGRALARSYRATSVYVRLG